MEKFRVMVGYHSHDGDSAYSGRIGEKNRFDTLEEAETYAQRELRRDRGNYHATIQKVDEYDEFLGVVKEIEK